MIDRSAGPTHLFNLSAAVLKANHYRDLFPQIIHGFTIRGRQPSFHYRERRRRLRTRSVYAAATGQPDVNLFAC